MSGPAWDGLDWRSGDDVSGYRTDVFSHPHAVEAEEALRFLLRGSLGFTGTPIRADLRAALTAIAARS